MIEITKPMIKNDGYDYTEDFDGKQMKGINTIWCNFKCVVGKGGSQTRTLRDECYRFIDAQLQYLLKAKKENNYFANIFDGDEASSNMNKFKYLITLPEFNEISKYVYVGDLKGYFNWFNENVS